MTLLHIGNIADAQWHLSRAMDSYTEERHAKEPMGDPGVMALAYLARAAMLSGRTREARRLDGEVLALAERVRKPPDTLDALTWSAMLHAMMGQPQEALEKAESAVRGADELGMQPRMAEARSVRAWANAALGRVSEGIQEMRIVDEVFFGTGTLGRSRSGGARWAGFHTGFLAETYGSAGLFDEGIAAVDAALEALPERHVERSNLLRLRGELVLGSVRPTDEQFDLAEQYYRKAIDIAHEQGTVAYELRAALSLAHLMTSRGRAEEGRTAVSRALGAFADGDETAHVREAKALLGE
jgi:tetratricopeptide (TPR) repeat protein